MKNIGKTNTTGTSVNANERTSKATRRPSSSTSSRTERERQMATVEQSSVSGRCRRQTSTHLERLRAQQAQDERFVTSLLRPLVPALRRAGVPVSFVKMRAVVEMHEARMRQMSTAETNAIGRSTISLAPVIYRNLRERALTATRDYFAHALPAQAELEKMVATGLNGGLKQHEKLLESRLPPDIDPFWQVLRPEVLHHVAAAAQIRGAELPELFRYQWCTQA